MMKKSNALYGIGTKNKLCTLLSIEKNILKTLGSEKDYKVKQQLKHNGNGYRTIEAPSLELKKIQRKINKILQKLDVPNYLYSGIKGKCFIDNALVHINGKYVLCVDISSFYPSTNSNAVFQFFKYHMNIPDDIAWLLTQITTFRNHLPTGAPTSVILAYFAYEKTFNEIYQKAKENNIIMSVYIDDLTFSSEKEIPVNFYNFVEKRMKDVGLKLKKEKTQRYKPDDFKIITGNGISPNSESKVPLKNILKIKKILNGRNLKELSHDDLISLRGSLIVARRIEDNFFTSLYNRTIKLIKARKTL